MTALPGLSSAAIAAPGRSGLSSSEAARRLALDGPNTLPQPQRRNWLSIALKVVREPMLVLLMAAASVYLLIGSPHEAMLLGASVLAVIAMAIYQELKSEKALQALRDLSSPRARVLRDGAPRLIPARDVVRGEILLVSEGERLPADARVLDEVDLYVDESLLTGESLPVRRPGGGEGLLHASTLVVRGHGTAEVVAVGAATAVGRIGAALGEIKPEKTALQREIRRIVLLFALLSLLSCALMTGLYLATRGGWLDALLAGITLAMANIPEEFPVVLTVFLALGAWRMARQAALVRRMPAIEALGAITVLCTDKTGTLTENRMQLAELRCNGHSGPVQRPLPPIFRQLLRTSMLASPRVSYDPMETAVQEAWRASGIQEPPKRLLREYAFSPHMPAVAAAWDCGADGVLAACKGAPETVAALCGGLSAMSRAGILDEAGRMAASGLRVLGVASARLAGGSALPDAMEGIAFGWEGLIGFADPLRPGVAGAVAEARQAGVRVVMLTGDHPETARAIARQAGISGSDKIALGAQLDAAPDQALDALIGLEVYARVRPEHKLRLVRALKERGEVVAMTGDGVNDAPALLASNVGIAMGKRGTDVAREAAAIVLLDDNFVTVVQAIKLGRTIYDNIQRAIRYILAVHVPITGLALLPLLVGGPLILLPLHVVFLELIIDPACSIVLEREPPAADLMRRPPRPAGQRMIDATCLLGSLLQGAAMFALVLAIYLAATFHALPAPQLAALSFTALVAANLGLIVLFRAGGSWTETLRIANPAFWVVAVVTLVLLSAVTWMPRAAHVFGFSAPPFAWWAASLAAPLLLAAALNAIPEALSPRGLGH